MIAAVHCRHSSRDCVFDVYVRDCLQCYYGNATTLANGTAVCKCQSGWSGRHCTLTSKAQCNHGVYDAAKDYCMCDAMWSGAVRDSNALRALSVTHWWPLGVTGIACALVCL